MSGELNVHKNLDDPNLHEAKGFSSSLRNDHLVRNEREISAWEQRMVLLPALALVSSMAAPPTENDGDIYILNSAAGDLNINTIVWQAANTIRYTFNATPDLTGVTVGDYFKCKSATFALNNGRFLITAKNNGAYWIEVTNPERVDGTEDEGSDSPGIGQVTLSNWDGCGQGEWVRYSVVDGRWNYIVPPAGTICYITGSNSIYIFNGGVFISSSSSANITAHSTGGQALATPITAKITTCSTAGADHDSVLAPDATVDNEFIFKNKTAYIIDLYPRTGKNFEGLAANAPFEVPPGQMVKMYCLTAGEHEQI